MMSLDVLVVGTEETAVAPDAMTTNAARLAAMECVHGRKNNFQATEVSKNREPRQEMEEAKVSVLPHGHNDFSSKISSHFDYVHGLHADILESLTMIFIEIKSQTSI